MSRRGYVVTAAVASLSLAVMGAVEVTPRLLWNASASVPVGLYALRPTGRLAIGDLVAVTPPTPLAWFLATRHYLPLDTPLMKRVMGLPGQRVCRVGNTVTIDAVPLGDALDHDRRGRPLPVWRSCRRIAAGEVFLMNPSVPDSLDGRYFGPLPVATVIGTATPLYTDEAGDGRFVWRAATR
ncbi:MAG: S26 family signal peptidase [Methylorubrum populi]